MRSEHNIPPDAVQDITVREDPHIKVGLNDIMELPVLLIPEKRVRHPDLEIFINKTATSYLSPSSITLSFSVIVR